MSSPSITAASFFLNAVFAFAIAKPGAPQIRPAFSQAREHLRPILSWGFTIGVALWFGAIIVQRWGKGWYALTLSIVVAVMMFAYVAVPSRLVGIKSARSRRDKLTATAVGGAIGGVVCSPPYALGRVAILLLGSHTFRVLAVIMLAVAVVLQTGATTATKAIKFSAKLVVSHKPPGSDEGDTAEAGPEAAKVAASGHGLGEGRYGAVTFWLAHNRLGYCRKRRRNRHRAEEVLTTHSDALGTLRPSLQPAH